MAKLTKTALKSLVKECLVEILSEGIGNSSVNESVKRTKKNPDSNRRRLEEQRLAQHRKKFETRVSNTVNDLTDDPMMQSIFADTAKTTLQEQSSKEIRTHQSDLSAPDTGNPGVDLGGIFDGASANWSQLAFSEKKKSELNN